MINQLKPLVLTVTFAGLLLLGTQWAVAHSATAATESAATSVNRRPIVSSPITDTSAFTIYLPLITRNYPALEEFRGLWVTRFDWTRFGYTATPSDIDTIVNNAASAHFNALLFQVRGTADAYYSSTLEPWAARLTGSTTRTLGVDPGWDPLAYLITRAHQSGLQVHAYINIFPTWLCGAGAPPANTAPQHLFWTLSHSTTWSAWRVYRDAETPMSIDTCSDYLWATPALSLTRNHITAVATDIVSHYAVDGIHLDLIRYPGPNYSTDPYTMQAFSAALKMTPTLVFTTWQPDFQRAQVNATVQQIYSATTAIRPDLLVSAAVWPNYASGYNSYYQDSKAWLAGGIVDANIPMLYASDIVNDLPAWITRTQGFVNDSHGRWVIPGIGLQYTIATQTYCVPFDDIRGRIEAVRSMNAPGVVFFSYGAMNSCNYWSNLASGPFAAVAAVPRPSWKP